MELHQIFPHLDLPCILNTLSLYDGDRERCVEHLIRLQIELERDQQMQEMQRRLQVEEAASKVRKDEVRMVRGVGAVN